MENKKIIFFILNFLIILFLVGYWINPGGDIDFLMKEGNSEFHLENSSNNMQFYENMRFPETNISYHIDESCTLTKKKNMEKAFEILQNETILNFYSVLEKEEITVKCKEENRFKGGLYIGGEGGPTNITGGNFFTIILNGEILLLKDFPCKRPNVEIHELLHVLGFNHSENKYNIMYPISDCRQTIGEEIISEINRIYSYSPKQDLTFGNASAFFHGRYLDVNFSVYNEGLIPSEKSFVEIYVDEKKIKEVEISPMYPGAGFEIKLTNIIVSKIKLDSVELAIPESDLELFNDNNRIFLLKKG